MRRHEKIRIILWSINICLALLAFSLIVYFIVFEVVYKEKNLVQKLVFNKEALNNLRSESSLSEFSPAWNLVVRVVGQKPKTASNPPTVKQKPDSSTQPNLDKELTLIACAVDTDSAKSYCILQDLRTKKQILVGEGYIIERLAARIVSILPQKIQLIYQGKVCDLEKKIASGSLTSVSANKYGGEGNQTQGFEWIKSIFSNAQLEDTSNGIKVEDPAELRRMGILPGDILISVDDKSVFQNQALIQLFKDSSSLPFWTLTLKRGNEKISLVILKKR